MLSTGGNALLESRHIWCLISEVADDITVHARADPVDDPLIGQDVLGWIFNRGCTRFMPGFCLDSRSARWEAEG